MAPIRTSNESTRWRVVRVVSGRLRKWGETFAFPFILSLIFSLVFALPEQFLELYRIMAGDAVFAVQEGGNAVGWIAVSYASVKTFLPLFGALLVLSVALALSARVVEVLGRSPRRPSAPHWQAYYAYMPLAIGILPVAGTVTGILSARSISTQRNIAEQTKQLLMLGDESLARTHSKYIAFSKITDTVLDGMAILCLVFAVVFVYLGYMLYHNTSVSDRLYESAKRPFPLLILSALVVVAIALLLRYPVTLPQSVGVFGVLAIFGATLAIIGACLIVHSRRIGFPVIATLAAWAIALTLFDCNDNHQLTYVNDQHQEVYPTNSQLKAFSPLPEVEKDFIDWLKNRRGMTFEPSARDATKGTWATNNGKKFPIYVVAAQGGGIYAAAQANMFLVQTTAMCEQFPQHLFAISSVSGGSVGSALFSAALTKFGSKDGKCAPFEKILHPSKDTFSPDALKVLAATYDMALDDWLSPLMGAALFPDFAQRFLPYPFARLSRARALEAAIAQSWANHHLADREGENPLEEGVVASWDPKGIRPALLFNTTESASGRRRVIAPFRFEVPERFDLQFLPASKPFDVTLSTAAVASARFPYLTPAAWFWPLSENKRGATTPSGVASEGRRVRIVDGGYFENSGVATASDLVARLEEIVLKRRLPVEIHMIVLTYGRYPERKHYAFGEFLAPIRSLLNTRESRTLSTIALADREMGTIDGAAPVRRLQRVTVSDFYTPLPLGWRLSKIGVLQIRRGMTRIAYCYPNAAFVQAAGTPALGDGNCVDRLIWHQLRGDDILESREKACQQAADRAKKAGGDFAC